MDVLSKPRLIAAFLTFFLLAGCTAAALSPTALPPSNLRPYATETVAVIPSQTISATEIPLPSPTPSTYKVIVGDSLGIIAEHFGISLAALQAANPGVVSESLSVGQSLKIPAASADTPGSSIPDPALAQVDAPVCYPSGDGMYCLALVHNPFPDRLENVKLQMTLLDPKGRKLASLEAFLPLNILPPGSALPAYAYFPAHQTSADPQSTPVAAAQPVAQLASAIRLFPGDQRYLPAVVRNLLVGIDWDGHSARLQGQVFLPADAKAAGTVWLAAVAYDAGNQVVGSRRWEWQGRLRPGRNQPFDFSVYSVGPVIERVEVVVEARPQ